MKRMKRLLALLLALTMVLGMFPAAAAEEEADVLSTVLVEDDQTLLEYLQDGQPQRLVTVNDMTLTLVHDLTTEDQVVAGEDERGIHFLAVAGATLTCASADYPVGSMEALEEAMSQAPHANVDAAERHIWVMNGLDLDGVTVPEDRVLSWFAASEGQEITGQWPVLQSLYVPGENGVTVRTDLTVEDRVQVDGDLFLEDGVTLTAKVITGSGSCWWTVNEKVHCENIEHVSYPNGNEYTADYGAKLVDVYDEPSLLYYLTDGIAQEVNVSADLQLSVDTDIVSEDGLYANYRLEDDDTGLRGNLYRLEILGEGTLTVADLGLAAWEQEQMDAAIAGTYPIEVSEGGYTRLFLEGDFRIEETTVLPSMTSFLFGAHSALTLAEGVRLSSEAGLWNLNYGGDLADLNRAFSLKNNALIDAIYYNPQTEASVRVWYMSEQDFLTDWAAKKDAYPLLESVLISTDVDGEPGSFDLTGDWTVGELGEIFAQDGTSLTIKSGAKVQASALYLENPQDTDACLLTVESGAEVSLGYLNVEASAWWPADVEIFFDSADIRYYAPMLFFRVLGWDDGRQVHVDDFDMGAFSEWPLRISPAQEKVGYIACCYPAVEGVPAGMADWSFSPLDVTAEGVTMTENIEAELLEEELRDEETVPWETYRFRTDAWSSEEELGIAYAAGGYDLQLGILSELGTVEYFSAPSREEQYAVKELHCDTFSSTEEEYYLIFRPEYDGQYVDRVELLGGEATVEATEDENIWKITVTGGESFSLDLCLYVADDYSEPWEWYTGIWVRCDGTERELVEIWSAEEMLAHLTNGVSEQLAAMVDLEITLTEDIRSNDYVGANFDEATGRFYQTRFVGDGILYVPEYEAAVNNTDQWADMLAGVANVEAETLYVFINDKVTVSESAELGDTSLYLTAAADLQLAPGVAVSSRGGMWNLNYAAMEGDDSLNRDFSLKNNAFADVIYSKDDGSSLRVLYADEETFLGDLPGKLEEYASIDLIILSTDDENGDTDTVEIDEAWSLIGDKVYTLAVQDGTTLTISTDLELGELAVEDADDEAVRTDVVAVNVTGDTNLTVWDITYIEGDLACGSGRIELYGDVNITGRRPGLMAMYLEWDEEDRCQKETENVTDYLGRTLLANEHPMLFFVSIYEDGQWVQKPVIPEAEGVEIWKDPEDAGAQENGSWFVRIRAHDWFCEHTYTAELDGVTYTMYGDSYPAGVEFFSEPWDNYDAFLNGVQLSPVQDNVFYAVVTNEDLQWSNAALRKDIAPYAVMEDTEDGNVKKITISAENARQMLMDGIHSMDVVVTYDALYPDWEEPQYQDAWLWTGVENGMVFVPNGAVPETTVEFPGASEYMNNNRADLSLAPKDVITGVLYFVWYDYDSGAWKADPYSGECLWQEGDSVELSVNAFGQTVITGVHGGDTYIHHTGFYQDENGDWQPNAPGVWHGVPFPVHVGKGADVTSEAELEAALEDETVTDIHVDTSFAVTENLYVNKPLHFGENGCISVTGNAVLTLVEPGFRDCAEHNVDYWLMFMDHPEDVRTCYFCGNGQAAQEMAAQFNGAVDGMYTDWVDSRRVITFGEGWPGLEIGESFVHPGNVYEVDGAELTFGYLFATVENFDEEMDPNEMPTPLKVNGGAVTITEQLIINGNVYWAPGASVSWTENYHISGQYPHLSFRWLDNWGEGWFENMDNDPDVRVTMPQIDDRWMSFYATVPVWEGETLTWSTAPVAVSDGLEEGSAVTYVKDMEHESIREDQERGDYFVRILPEHYDWNEAIELTAEQDGYTLTMDVPLVLPEIGFFTRPEYAEEYYTNEIRLSEDPEENVWYLIVHTPENAGHWMEHYEFHEGADRIHAEDLGDGIIRITLQDWVDVYEYFHLHAEVFWADQENTWSNGQGIGVNGAVNTTPYLTQTWLDEWGEGWFVSEDAMNHQGEEFRAPWFEEQWRIFFLNVYDETREQWITSPVEVAVAEDAPVELIHMTDGEEYPKAEDALFPGYYYRVTPHEDVWDETVEFTYTMADGTVLTLPLYIGRNELGFYTDANICNENYMTTFDLNRGENVFYLGIDIPENENGDPAYGVSDVWVVENEWAGMVEDIWRLTDRLWQIKLTEDAARSMESFHLDFEMQIDWGDHQEIWGTGIHCSAGDPGRDAAAVIEINGSSYLFYADTDAVLKEYFTGDYNEDGHEIWDRQWMDGIDVDGVFYDPHANQLTLQDAQLEDLHLRYRDVWTDDEGVEHVAQHLPGAEVLLEVLGENTITADGTAALEINCGAKVKMVGDGTLHLLTGETETCCGQAAILIHQNSSLTITDRVTVTAETKDYGMERDEEGNPVLNETGDPRRYGAYAVQGDYGSRSALTVEGEANVTLSGAGGGLECVSTVIFKDHAVVQSHNIRINAEPALRPSMTVSGNAAVTVTAREKDEGSVAMEFFDGGKLYLRGGELTVDNTALQNVDTAIWFSQNMYSLKGGLQISDGVLCVNAAGGTGIGMDNGNAYQQNGGEVHVTVGSDGPEGWGSWGLATQARVEFVITGGEANFTATQCDSSEAAGILFQSSDGSILGGSLNCAAVHRGGERILTGLFVARGSLSITGGSHSFVILDPDGTVNTSTRRGVGVITQEHAYLAFNGGTSRLAGYCAAWANSVENGISMAEGIHAVSNDTGNELVMVYYDESAYTDINGDRADHIHWFEEDNVVTYPEGDEPYDESDLCHDVTISGEAGNAVVNAASVDITVTNGAPALGAKMSVRATIGIIEGGEATVSVLLPADMKDHVLPNSISLNDKQIPSLEEIPITGPSVLRFDVVPMDDHDGEAQNIVVRVTKDSQNVGEASYGFVPTEFDVNAPSHTSTSAVTITGKAYPGYTVTVTDKSNNSVSATVNELGYYSLQFSALVEGTNALDVYFGGSYMKTLTVSYEEPKVEIRSLTIRNNVHNSYGKTVEESVAIAYPAGTPGRNFYTYWPGQDVFRFELSLEGTAYVKDAWIIVTDYDGRTVRINLDTARPGFYEGEYLNEDPDCPPVGFEVHWLQIVNIQEPDVTEEHHTTNTEIVPIMDPSGFVYEGIEDNRVEGATVTLEYGQEDEEGNVGYAGDWNAEAYGQTNGYLTNVKGEFKWDVPAGWWRVRVEKDGYETACSEWLQVPPPQLGVRINLQPTAPAALYEELTVEEGVVKLHFTQPVQFHTLEKAITVTDAYGNALQGELLAGKVLEVRGSVKLVREVVFVPEQPVYNVKAFVTGAARSVYGEPVQESEASFGFTDPVLTGNTATVEVDLPVMLMGEAPVALVAAYDADGKYLGMEAQPLETGTLTAQCPEGTAQFRVFAVESMETMVPMWAAVTGK